MSARLAAHWSAAASIVTAVAALNAAYPDSILAKAAWGAPLVAALVMAARFGLAAGLAGQALAAVALLLAAAAGRDGPNPGSALAAAVATSVASLLALPGLIRMRSALAGLEERAGADPLTGALDGSLLPRKLDEAVAHSEWTGNPFCVLSLGASLDPDGGADAGRALRELAAALRGALREGDALFHLGGGEFVVLMPDASARDGWAAKRRLADLAARIPAGRPVRVSVGIAEYPGDARRPAELAAAARRAMLAEQTGGRREGRR